MIKFFQSVKKALIRLAFSQGWIKGYHVVMPELFDHNSLEMERPWPTTMNQCHLGKFVLRIAAYHDGFAFHPLPPCYCTLNSETADWLNDNEIIYRVPLEMQIGRDRRHRIIIARKSDFALFKIRFECGENGY